DKEEKEEKEEFTSRPFKEDSKGFRRARTTFDEPLESARYRDQKRRLAQEQLKEEKRQNRRRIIRMVVCTIFTLEALIFSGYFIFLLLLSGIISSTEVSCIPFHFLYFNSLPISPFSEKIILKKYLRRRSIVFAAPFLYRSEGRSKIAPLITSQEKRLL
ncbi:hypothetical protein ANCCAN_05284, partial [Ancylostoma caninum]